LDDTEFKTWLEQSGAQTEAGRNTRTHAVRTIERNLAALGMPYENLEQAWKADQFAGLRERLKMMRNDARSGGEDYRILMPDSEKPHNRLSNWSSWLSQYGRFIAGEPPGAAKDADRIRQHVLQEYIEPAREEGTSHVDVLVRDVNTALDLNQAWPNICQAMAGKIFQELAQISAPERIGADQSPATLFRFRLDESAASQNERPFTLFDAAGNPYQPVKNFNRSNGVSAYRIKPKGAGNKADEAIETEDMVDVARALLVDGLASRVKAIAGGAVNYLTYGGEKLVRYQLDPDIARKIGVLANGSVQEPTNQVENTMAIAQQEECPTATTLILYGPPGTGKTFSTAAEAVRLCGEPIPEGREDLMAVYQGLLAAGRIEFVTFHQSMAYEEFVEGRQPMTGADDGDDTSTAGFRLETVPGIFRRIAKRAETSRGHSSAEDSIRVEGRQVFKMSIGEANNPEDAHLFEEAIEGGYTLLGFEDIDWSDEKFTRRDEIIEACKSQGEQDGNVDARSGVVQMPFIFRNWVQKGDIVIVSKGNGLFRAIGEFTGGYEFAPRPGGGYAHRRAVRWLWVDREGVPVGEIYSRRFSMKSIYLLYDAELNVPALERYMNSQQHEGPSDPEPFVLIIDEINRANISKVFGELITLLEPDKRLGQPNQLKVRLPYSGDEFGVPSNLHIVGTMNTADRSIALLDTALRRRFTFREMMPNSTVLDEAADRTGIDLPRLLTIINERIEYLYDRDHQIGHAYFTGCDTRAGVDEVMRHKVIPLLAEYFFEDWGKIAAVLGDLDTHDGPIRGGFLNRSVLKAPPALDNGEAMPRFRWDVRSAEDDFDYTRLLG
jgi:5-methylcytosine-specific restriction protein B